MLAASYARLDRDEIIYFRAYGNLDSGECGMCVGRNSFFTNLHDFRLCSPGPEILYRPKGSSQTGGALLLQAVELTFHPFYGIGNVCAPGSSGSGGLNHYAAPNCS